MNLMGYARQVHCGAIAFRWILLILFMWQVVFACFGSKSTAWGSLHLCRRNRVAATSGCFSFGSGCLFGPCWSVFHPKSGMRPCGIRFLAVLPVLYTCSSCVATFSVMLMRLTSVMWTLCSFPLLSDT